MLTVGIDAEPDGVLDHVMLSAERAMLQELPEERPGINWDRLLFSAKESTYKAWFPLTRRWLGFEDADITINSSDGTFRSHLLATAPAAVGGFPLVGFAGRWMARDGLILTAVTVLA